MRTLRLALPAVRPAPVLVLGQGSVAGTRTATFPIQVGDQEYACEFSVKGTDEAMCEDLIMKRAK